MKQILQRLLPEIIKIRHKLHANPELSHREKDTSFLISNILKSYGYEVKFVAETGVIALLDSGKPGRTVALRADIDALPLQEQTNLPYQSENNGVMHACGHDGHTATLLAVAKTLKEYAPPFKGKIKFIFQPAEETGTGATAMIKDNVLEDPNVDVIFGYHNMPGFPKNKIIVRDQCILAGATTFQISIKGIGGHASAPEKTVDPIYTGSHIVEAIQSIISRNTSPFEHTVISITQFHAGTADNIIPETALLRGTIRFSKEPELDFIKFKMIQLVEGTAKSLGAKATIEFFKTVPATINALEETNLVKKVAIDLFGKDNLIELEHNLMPFEDFSFYLNQLPGCYFMVGTGIEKQYCHHPEYIFDDDIIPIAAEMLATVALNYLCESIVALPRD